MAADAAREPRVFFDALPGDLVSDWLQADAAIMWDRREGGSTQVQARGLTLEQVEEVLLACAADVHRHRTGVRAGALIVEDGDGPALMCSLRRALISPLDPGTSSDLTVLRDRLDAMLAERRLR